MTNISGITGQADQQFFTYRATPALSVAFNNMGREKMS
jgi:hypothetical protein